MRMDFSKLLLYLACGFCGIFLSQIGNTYEPFSLALFFGMASAGLSPVLSALLYLLSGMLAWSIPVFLLYIGQAVLLCAGFYLLVYPSKRCAQKMMLAPVRFF